jgi:hypothetical protein
MGKVLVACEFSGIVRNSFLALGHDAYSCDLRDCKNGPKERHIRGDVESLLEERWDLVIAHPPCTFLAKSGAQWMRKDKTRVMEMILGVAFFKKCLAANSPRVCVENPLLTLKVLDLIGTKYTQIIHPYQFGHDEDKTTCLWLKGLPLLEPTGKVEVRKGYFFRDKFGWGDRWKKSITYPGIGKAMAEQWGRLI